MLKIFLLLITTQIIIINSAQAGIFDLPFLKKTERIYDLDVGECFAMEDKNQDKVYSVECNENHNGEVITKHESLPEEYKLSQAPVYETCGYDLINYIKSIDSRFHLQNEYQVELLNERVEIFYAFKDEANLVDARVRELDWSFSCTIYYKKKLNTGTFREYIEIMASQLWD